MGNHNEMQRCIDFLVHNGWNNGWNNEAFTPDDDYISFGKEEYLQVDIGEEEIVIIADEGDIEHLPVNKYALLGYLFDARQIDCGYKSQPSKSVEKFIGGFYDKD
jgi:hypothetical protein